MICCVQSLLTLKPPEPKTTTKHIKLSILSKSVIVCGVPIVPLKRTFKSFKLLFISVFSFTVFKSDFYMQTTSFNPFRNDK